MGQSWFAWISTGPQITRAVGRVFHIQARRQSSLGMTLPIILAAMPKKKKGINKTRIVAKKNKGQCFDFQLRNAVDVDLGSGTIGK